MWMQEQTDSEWGRVSLLEEVSTEPRAAAARLQAVLKLSLRADLDSLYLLLEVLNILSSRASTSQPVTTLPCFPSPAPVQFGRSQRDRRRAHVTSD